MSILITEVEKAGIRDGETEAREVRWLPQSHRELEFESSVQTLWDNALSSMPLFLLLVTKGNGVGGCSIDTVEVMFLEILWVFFIFDFLVSLSLVM